LEGGSNDLEAQALAMSGDRVVTDAALTAQRKVLQDFWGADFGEIEAQAKAKGIDLDKPSSVVPWEQAERRFFEKLTTNAPPLESRLPPDDAWPETVTQEFLEDEWGDLEIALTTAELAAVSSIAAPYCREIDTLGSQKREVLQKAMLDAWHRGDFVRAPLFLPDNRSVAGDNAVRRTMTHGGWCIDLAVKKADWPILDEVSSQMDRAKAERRRQVEEYLSSLSGK
jgi:hypothetical protein